MNEIDSLLSQFQTNGEQSTPLMWGETTEEKPTPESEDGERLEQSIRDVFSNKQLLNKALATFLGVFTANAGVSLLTTLGIGAIASGTLSSIVLGLFFANTLTKIQYDGRIHIGKDFMVATAQTASVGASLWVAFDEYRAVSGATKTGKTRFYSEVRQYEVKPSPQTETPWLMIGLAGFGLLVIAAMTRGEKPMKRKQFEDYLRSGTANNITVGVLATIGLICGAKSFTGTQISLVEYCFIPETLKNPVNRQRYCTPNKRYIMPESEFYAEAYTPANPEFQRDNFLPTKATRLRIIEPSNPDKALWGLASVFFLGGAFTLSKAREWRLIQLMPSVREEIRSNWLISKLWYGLRLHKEAYSAQLDYEFHQWSENRRVRAAQLSKMTPQELAIFQEQVRLRAEAEARVQLQQATGQPAAALPGQSMQDIARGDDKVTGSEQQTLQQNTNGSLDPSEALALNTLQALARADSSTALVAAPGSGKSVTLNYLIEKILADSPNADIWVISAKNDSFCGLREKERVIVFDGENPDLAKEVIDRFYLNYKQRKQLPESKRESLPPLILILDDWLVIADSLSKLYSDWNYGSKLLDVLLIGREFNTKFIASLQSFNLAALGIEKMDAQTRLCLNLLLLGNRYVKNGREQESYGVLELILNRGDIIPGKQEREQIKSKYLDVKAVSYQNLRPVMIASVGGFVVALMPKLSNQVKPIASEQEYLDRVFDLEFNLNAAHNVHPKPLSEVAKKIYEYFHNVKNKTPKTLRDLKKADRLSGYEEQELIDGLAELVKADQINSDAPDSYSLPDW